MGANGSLDARRSGAGADATTGSSNKFDTKILLSVLAQVAEGDFSARMPLEWTGVAGKAADGINDVIVANQALATELERISRVVGKQGELSQRVQAGRPRVGRAASSWSTV